MEKYKKLNDIILDDDGNANVQKLMEQILEKVIREKELQQNQMLYVQSDNAQSQSTFNVKKLSLDYS